MGDHESIEARVARLEDGVLRLEQIVKRLSARFETLHPREANRAELPQSRRFEDPLLRRTPGQAGVAGASPPPTTRAARTKRPRAQSRHDSQWWLSRIGIALLLVGIVYLYRYAIDQGWLHPSIRVAIGLGLGVALMTLGVRLHATLRWYARALLIGGIVTQFITAFAALHWYALVSQPVAIGFLAVVALVSFGLSLRLNDVPVAVTGAVGALLNPILLFEAPGSIPGLMSYETGALAVLSAVFLARGWRTVLWVSFYLTWVVLFLTAVGAATDDRLWTQLGIAAALAAFWLIPVFREHLTMLDPERWPRPPLGRGHEHPSTGFDRHAHVLSVLTPLVALGVTANLWDLSKEQAGWLSGGGGLLALVMAIVVRQWRTGDRLAFSQAISVVTLLTLALSLLLDGNALLVAFTIEAAALHVIGLKTVDDIPLRAGQAMLIAAAGWVGARLASLPGLGPPVFNPNAFVDGLMIVIALGLAARLASSREAAGYRLVAHILLLGWLARELSTLPNGNGFVTLAWGVYGIGLLIHALTRRRAQLQRVAMATLLLVVAKLFLVDLAQLAPVWRIVLFMGFGGLFLILSYYFQDLWVGGRSPPVPPATTPQASPPSSSPP